MIDDSKYKDAGILMQVITTIFLIMFILLYLISNIDAFANIVGFLLGILLLVMAFNNHVSYKRKYFTLFYSLAGVIFLVMSALKYI